MQVQLNRLHRGVPGDNPEDVDGDACIGHPRQAGVAEIVSAKLDVEITDGSARARVRLRVDLALAGVGLDRHLRGAPQPRRRSPIGHRF
jgi:hypothetical protein